MKDALDPKVAVGSIIGILVLLGIVFFFVNAGRKPAPVTPAQVEATKMKVEQEIETKAKQ